MSNFTFTIISCIRLSTELNTFNLLTGCFNVSSEKAIKANVFNMTAPNYSYVLNVFSSFSQQQRINEAIRKENEQDVPIFNKEQIEGDGFFCCSFLKYL